MIVNVNPEYAVELHEILCRTERHPAVESIIKQLEEQLEFFTDTL